MFRRGPILLGCFLVGMILPRIAQSQLPVTDVGNLAVNTTTSVQAAITATEAVLQTAAALEELLPLDAIIAAEGIAEDLVALADILAQAQGLSYDLQSLESQIETLLNLDTAPADVESLQVRFVELRTLVVQGRTFGLRIQTLITTLFRTIDHTIALVSSVAAFVGQKQGLQTLAQQQSNMSKTLTILTATNIAWQRNDLVERWAKDVVIESIHRIDYERLGSWKGR